MRHQITILHSRRCILAASVCYAAQMHQTASGRFLPAERYDLGITHGFMHLSVDLREVSFRFHKAPHRSQHHGFYTRSCYASSREGNDRKSAPWNARYATMTKNYLQTAMPAASLTFIPHLQREPYPYTAAACCHAPPLPLHL